MSILRGLGFGRDTPGNNLQRTAEEDALTLRELEGTDSTEEAWVKVDRDDLQRKIKQLEE